MGISVGDLPAKYQKMVLEQLQKQKKQEAAEPEQKQSKYHNRKTQVNGITFDSRREARRYEQLMEYLAAGWIHDLQLQREFLLQPGYMQPDGQKVGAIRYRADFCYKMGDRMPREWEAPEADREYWSKLHPDYFVIEDSKGKRTDVYLMKKKMMADRGLYIREV